MLDSLRAATHVLRTGEYSVEVLSFDSRNTLMARFPYPTRQSAIKAVEDMTGKRIVLKPMQTPAAERVYYDNNIDTDESIED